MGKDELVTQSAALLGKYIRKTSSEVLEKKRSYKYVFTDGEYGGCGGTRCESQVCCCMGMVCTFHHTLSSK